MNNHPTSPSDTLHRILARRPELHFDRNSQPISWALEDDALRILHRLADPGGTTVETGCGVSTLVLASKGCHHTAVAPAAREFEAIRRVADELGISLDTTTFVDSRSEDWLPCLHTELDLFLIDGRHAFPTPMVDWFYGGRRLKVGGQLVVDDVQLPSVRMLVDFLDEDDYWERTSGSSRTAVFRKLGNDGFIVEWNRQPFIRSRMPEV